jgi:hypothetical protein
VVCAGKPEAFPSADGQSRFPPDFDATLQRARAQTPAQCQLSQWMLKLAH